MSADNKSLIEQAKFKFEFMTMMLSCGRFSEADEAMSQGFELLESAQERLEELEGAISNLWGDI